MVFFISVVLGLLFCAKLVKWLLTEFAMPTYSAILGLVLGSVLCIFLGWTQMLNIGPILACVLGRAVITLCNKFFPEEILDHTKNASAWQIASWGVFFRQAAMN